MILISACLVGVNCKYNGSNNLDEKIKKLFKEGHAILVCPEQLGGLSTPRVPCEIVDYNKKTVVNKFGKDVSEEFLKGANETLKITKELGINIAILKQRSPSCGFGEIYDGTFSGNIKKGNGITANLLLQNGIKIFTEESIDELIKKN